MLDTLAQNKTYVTVTGEKIEANRTFGYEGIGESHDSKRNITAKIIQNSIMNFASWKRRGITTDFLGNHKKEYDSSDGQGGLQDYEQKKAMEAILGMKVEIYSNVDYSPDELTKIIQNLKPSIANPVLISLAYDSAGRDAFHAVNVINIDDKNVTIINPWGREETFSIDKLKDRFYRVFGPAGAEKSINRISSSQLKEIIAKDDHWYEATNGVSKIINDNSKRNELLSKLNFNQKINLIKSLHSGNVTNNDKIATLRILENILQGREGQDSQVIGKLTSALNEKKINYLKLLKNLKADNELFYSIASQIFNIIDDEKSKSFVANIIMETNKAEKFINSISDKDLALIAKNFDGDKMADTPKVAAKLLVGMIKIYNLESEKETDEKKSSVTLKDINDFISQIDKDWSDDDTMRIVLKEIGYKKETSKIDPKSDYTKFYFKNNNNPKILGKIIKIADF